MIRIGMIEDHPIVRAGLERLIAVIADVELVAAVDRVEDFPVLSPLPDVVMLDLHLPGELRELVAVRYLADLGHRVLIVTGDDTGISEIADAMAAGAQGYLTKRALPSEYEAAIRSIAGGHGYVGARLAAHARRESARRENGDHLRLTPRESEVAALVVDGYTNAEIAKLLSVGERTVDGHLESIKEKICETRRVRVAMRLAELGYHARPFKRS
jgi:DNA-binding NarL/FixJ family response regulator